jgi:4-amino-4-deoxychorismate lyase
MAVRLVATRGTERDGPTWYALADPVDSSIISRRRDGVSAIGLKRGIDPALADQTPWLLMGTKSLSYAVNMAARRWAHTQRAEDAILLGPGDLVLEATTSAVVIAKGRTILSPPASLGILPSITVARLFAAGNTRGWKVGHERLTMEDLYSADGVWLLSSIVQAARVHTLDGRAHRPSPPRRHPGVAHDANDGRVIATGAR